jgi:hypothetical protein
MFQLPMAMAILYGPGVSGWLHQTFAIKTS